MSLSHARTKHRAHLDDPAVYVVFLIVLALGVAFAFIGAETDDSLITYRYAERLADGAGFTYNDGERVLGTTTPLWTLILAAGAAAGTPPPVLADILNPIFGALSAALLYVLVARAWGAAAARFAAVLFAASPVLLRSAAYGMETPLFCLLLTATLYFVGGGRWMAAGTVLGLACITRLEGGLLGLAIVATNVRHPRNLIRIVVPAAVFVVPWATFATIYFGSPLPHSLQAKLVHDYRPDVLDTARFLLWESPHRLLLALTGTLGAFALLGGAVSGTHVTDSGAARGADAARRAVVTAALFAGGYVLFYLIGHPVPYEWYLPPLQIALVPLGGIALVEIGYLGAALITRVRGQAPPRSVRTPAVPLLGPAEPTTVARAETGLLIAILAVSASVLVPRTFSQQQIWRDRVTASFLPLVAWIDAHAPEDARIFAGDIGYVGYHTKRTILDASALVTPSMLEHRLEGREPNEMIADVLPEVLVFPVQPGVFPVDWPDAETRARYEARARFPEGQPLEMTRAEAREWFALQGGWKPDYVVYLRRDVVES